MRKKGIDYLSERKIKDNSMKTCKYCGSSLLVKYGTYHGTQLLWCKTCKRKLRECDLPFHSKVSASKISSTLIMYFCDESINAIRAYLRNEYDYYPSKSVIVKWINKYSEIAQKALSHYKPLISDQWIVIESIIKISKLKVRVLDIIDYRTRYLLSSNTILADTEIGIEKLLNQAIDIGGIIPTAITWDIASLKPDSRGTCHLPDYLPESIQFVKSKKLNQNNDESYIPSERNKILAGLRSMESAKQFLGRYNIHYNYFRPNDALGGSTPARAAGIEYPYKTWADIITKISPPKNT